MRRGLKPAFLVAWRRDVFVDGLVPGYGQRRFRRADEAREFAEQFDRPQAWAAVIGPDWRILAEFGYRFGVEPRKPPARATAPRSGVSTGIREGTESTMRVRAGARP